KKWNTKDLLTIFSDTITVKFTRPDGTSETLQGRWCTICKDNNVFVQKNGIRKMFHLGSNLLCHQHIRLHYKEY
ncbi:hypothetical protein SCLCIDRAFT_84344, partial [Scleroderma citrinum Foug A]